MKKSVLVILTMILIGSQTPIAHAEEPNNGDESVMKQNTAIFSLDNLEIIDSMIIYNDSGSKALVTIEKSDNQISTNVTTKSVQNETYKISYSTLAEKISFMINVRNGSITSAFSGTYSVFGYSVKSSYLSVINNKHASYTLECSFLFRSWTNRLNARINGLNQLEVQFNK